jgi:hypothetical protein
MLNFRTFEIWRLGTDESGAGYRREFLDTGLIITGHLGPSTPEFAALNEGEYGKIFPFRCDDAGADLRIGDRLIETPGGQVYDVKGVFPQTDGPGRYLQASVVLPHLT